MRDNTYSDYVVDIGPGASEHGGEIIACGTAEEIMKNPNSITGAYLSGKLSIPVPAKRRTYKIISPFMVRKRTTYKILM